MNDKTNLSDVKISSIEVEALKKKLKDLKLKKGIASRKIGEAKKSSESFQHLIDETKLYSIEIQKIQDELKQISIKQNQSSDDESTKKAVLPSQFKPRHINKARNKITADICSDMEKWNEYVDKHVNSSAYHNSSIKSVIESTFGHTCHYLIAEDESGEVRGVLPLTEIRSKLFGHFLISVPFFNYGGIIADTEEARKCLLTEAKLLAESLNVEHIEYRHTFQDESMPERSDKITMLLQLAESENKLWDDLGSKLRAQIKKPEKAGAITKIGREELVDDFYKVFSRNMRDLGTPVYSKALFVNMLKYNVKANIAVVYLNTQPVSVGFVLGWRDTLEIPWASTLRNANKYSVNMKLYWDILKFAIDQGYKVFDFGRSSKDSNTYRFKKQWGAEEYSLHWHYWLPDNQPLPQINPNNPKYRLLIYLWKKLPIAIANTIGPFIVKKLP